MQREKIRRTVSGWLMLPLLVASAAGLLYLFYLSVEADAPGFRPVACIVGLIFIGFLMIGFFIVNPNDAKALLLFGRYGGTVKDAGFHWANPCATSKARRSR
jgi:regulator of protease activity HflC (stomatin/prohibitin superfamily)